MKTFISVLLVALMVVSCSSGNNSKKSDDVDLTPLTISMDIHGMTCNGCVETVRSSVAQLGDGINSVKVDLTSAVALIEFVPAELDSVTIRKAIEINGYKVLAVKESAKE